MFKHLATSAGLVGTSIYETQSPWTGPEELKQANYILIVDVSHSVYNIVGRLFSLEQNSI